MKKQIEPTKIQQESEKLKKGRRLDRSKVHRSLRAAATTTLNLHHAAHNHAAWHFARKKNHAAWCKIWQPKRGRYRFSKKKKGWSPSTKILTDFTISAEHTNANKHHETWRELAHEFEKHKTYIHAPRIRTHSHGQAESQVCFFRQ